MSFLAKYLFKPHLDPGEEIMEVCHRHIFIIAKEFLRIGFLGFLVPLFFYYLFPEFAIFFIVWMVVSAIRIFYLIFNWYHDALLITNVSLIKVEWNGFFDRASNRLEYHNIDGLSYSIRGFRRTIFNYGDVQIGQVSSGATLTIKDAINPAGVEKKVLLHQERHVSNQNLKDADTLKTLLATMLRHHAKTQGIPSSQSSKNK